MSKSFRWTLVFLLTILIGLLAYRFAPKPFRHHIDDAIARLTAPNFIWTPDMISSVDQGRLIEEYEDKGFKLNCFSGLKDHQRIEPDEDYMCWAILKSAYDNISATMVSFFFKEGRLNHVRLEIPDSSFEALQNFLARKMVGLPRIDKLHRGNLGTDAYGKPLMVWETQSGLVITHAEVTSGQPVVLLWRNFPKAL